MLEKEYYSLEDAAPILKCKAGDLIHLGANDKLPIFALACDWWVELYCCNDPLYPTDPYGNEVLPRERDFHKTGIPFQVSGPVRLYPETLLKYEASDSATAKRFVAPHDDDAPEGYYEYRLCAEGDNKPQHDVALSTCVLVVMATDLFDYQQSSEQPQSTLEKPLSTREKHSLFKLVIGMAMMGYKYDPTAKKNVAVADICDDLKKLEIRLDNDTVKKWLDEAAKTVEPKLPNNI